MDRENPWSDVGGLRDWLEREQRQARQGCWPAIGRGRRATCDSPARARAVATVQEQPRRRQDQTATWSISTLQRRRPGEPGLARLGTSTIRRVLTEAGSNYQRGYERLEAALDRV